MIRVPVEKVQVLPNGERGEGRLQVFVAVRDDQGRLSKVRQIPYPLSASGDELATAQDKDIGYFTRLRVRAGTLRISAGVLDEISGERSVALREIVVGSDVDSVSKVSKK